MNTIAKTPENNAKVKALRHIPETKWAGSVTGNNLSDLLTGLNLQTSNSGWYNPSAIKINGITGYFMINQDGSIFCEARIVKETETTYRVEWMTMSAWYEFETLYSNFLNGN